MRNITVSLIILILCLGTTNIMGMHISEATPSIIILYNNNQDRNAISTIIQNDYSNVNYQSISSFDFNKLDSYNVLIFISGIDFSMDDINKELFNQFILAAKHTSFALTPYLNNLGGDILDNLGVLQTEDPYPENGSRSWDCRNSTGYEFTYNGKLTFIEANIGFDSMIDAVNFTNSETQEDETDIEFPQSILINSSTSSRQIYTGGFSLYDTSNSLELSQLPNFYDIISYILLNGINLHIKQVQNIQITDPVNNNISESNSGNNKGITLPLIPEDQTIWIYIIVLMLIATIITRLKHILRWIQDKLARFTFFIIGAFFKIQDRKISQNEIMLNQTRSNIVKYLEYMGEYGAHLREIKSQVKIGIGNLLWHLQVLMEYGWIEEYKIGRYSVYVISEFANKFDPELKELEFNLKSKHSLIFIRYLLDIKSDSISFSKINKDTKIDRKTISRFSKLLEMNNIIKISKEKVKQLTVVDHEYLSQLEDLFTSKEEFDLNKTNVTIEFQ